MRTHNGTNVFESLHHILVHDNFLAKKSDWTQLFDRAIEKPLVRIPHHITKLHTRTFLSIITDSHKEDTKGLDEVKRCSPLLGNTLDIMLHKKIGLRKRITQT